MRIILISFLQTTITALSEDTTAYLTTSLENVLQTQIETPEPVELQTEGDIPDWLSGSFYRNGPGKFEFGEDHFKHMFDPMAIVQQIKIENKKVSFNSRYIESRNFKANSALNKIVYPELGTGAEPDWIHFDENGEPLSEEEVQRNRLKFFMEDESKTDNTMVSLHNLCGNLVAFSETLSLHSIDHVTLETLNSFSVEQAANYPKDFIGMTHTPHGVFTHDGDFVNMMTGLLMEGLSDGVIRPPKVAYFMYRIPDARDSSKTIEQLLQSIEFSEPTHNEKLFEMKIGYMHEGVLAGDYFLAILSSSVTDISAVMANTKEGKPLMESIKHEPEREQEIRVFNLKTFRWEFENSVPKLPAGIMLHTVNGRVVDENDKQVDFEFDGLWSGNPSVLSLFYLDALRQKGPDFEELRSEATPSGQPTRINFTVKKGRQNSMVDLMFGPGQETQEPPSLRALVDNNDPEWAGYAQGGVEFPTINPVTRGFGSKHFWGVGYAQVLGDRLYHTNSESGERHVYLVEGYEPTEPVFVQRPNENGEDDGLLISAMLPIVQGKQGFVVILDARDMGEVARAYLPEELNLATSFHTLWL